MVPVPIPRVGRTCILACLLNDSIHYFFNWSPNFQKFSSSDFLTWGLLHFGEMSCISVKISLPFIAFLTQSANGPSSILTLPLLVSSHTYGFFASFLSCFLPSLGFSLFSFIFLYFSFSLSSFIAEMPASAISFHETHLASSFSALQLSPASHSDLLSHVQLVIHLVSHKHFHDTEKGPLSKNIYLLLLFMSKWSSVAEDNPGMFLLTHFLIHPNCGNHVIWEEGLRIVCMPFTIYSRLETWRKKVENLGNSYKYANKLVCGLIC